MWERHWTFSQAICYVGTALDITSAFAEGYTFECLHDSQTAAWYHYAGTASAETGIMASSALLLFQQRRSAPARPPLLE